jgi:hypothetical protein
MIYAFDDDERKIHILDAERGVGYSCFYCNTDVRTKQGTDMPWHFYHLDGDDAENCSFPPNIGCILNFAHHNGYCQAGHICEQECQFRRNSA